MLLVSKEAFWHVFFFFSFFHFFFFEPITSWIFNPPDWIQARQNGFKSIMRKHSNLFALAFHKKIYIFISKYVYNFQIDLYSREQNSIENFVFRPKMAIFRRAYMREGRLPLPLAFQYFIFMTWTACDLNLVMTSSLVS